MLMGPRKCGRSLALISKRVSNSARNSAFHLKNDAELFFLSRKCLNRSKSFFNLAYVFTRIMRGSLDGVQSTMRTSATFQQARSASCFCMDLRKKKMWQRTSFTLGNGPGLNVSSGSSRPSSSQIAFFGFLVFIITGKYAKAQQWYLNRWKD